MRKGLTPAERTELSFDPDGDAVHYLRVMADRHVFNVNKNPAALLSGKETPQQVLDIAIGFERDSILFFQAMEGVVPPSVGKDKVQTVIQEEVGHVAFLSVRKHGWRRDSATASGGIRGSPGMPPNAICG